MSPLFRPSDVLINDILGVIHLPRWREITEGSAPPFSLPLYPCFFQHHVPKLIELWEKQDSEKYAKLNSYLNSLCLATNVSTKRRGDRLDILLGWHQSVQPEGEKDKVTLSNVGVGVSQALPILAALVAAESRQVVYIEQPGIHLHPRAQTGLVSAIVDAAMRGVRVIIETHSATFLLALQVAIADKTKGLTSDQIALFWFQREADGATIIDRAELQSDGTYGDWPVDFTPVTTELQVKFAQTLANIWKKAEDA